MKPTQLAATAVAALGFVVLAACQDIPLLPKWDANEAVPLASQKITISPPFPAGVTVPNGTSQTVSFAAQPQEIKGLVDQVLTPGLAADTIFSVITKSASVTISGADTLFIASTQAGLGAAATSVIVPITIVATNTKDSAATGLTPAQLSILQGAATSTDTLWVQMRGRATCANAAGCTFTAGDSVGIKLTMHAVVHISR